MNSRLAYDSVVNNSEAVANNFFAKYFDLTHEQKVNEVEHFPDVK
jgi:hypothetical protein